MNENLTQMSAPYPSRRKSTITAFVYRNDNLSGDAEPSVPDQLRRWSLGSWWRQSTEHGTSRLAMRTLIHGLAGVLCVAQYAACGFPRPAEVGPTDDAALVLDAASSDDAGALLDAGTGTLLDAAPHMPYLEPRYLPDICDAVATMPDFTVSSSGSFDTGLDNNCNGGVVAQTGGPGICVVRYASIHITQAATLTVVGTRALALVADSALSVDGVLDVSAKGKTNGPGGGTVSGAQAGASAGGGGAGFKTAGGAGGSATQDGAGGAGGGAATDPSLLTVLVGGTRPSNGSAIFASGDATSGGAGGAATLIACRGDASVSGEISAGGGGGGAGFDQVSGAQLQFVAGAGGGAGGNIVLQGMTITVAGQLFANGGGGGAGNSANDGAGQAGADGTLSATVAASGGIAIGSEGAGGAGGRQGAAPSAGLHPTGNPSTAGGGGGSVGFFQTYAPVGVTPSLTPAAVSPAFSPNKTINTR